MIGWIFKLLVRLGWWGPAAALPNVFSWPRGDEAHTRADPVYPGGAPRTCFACTKPICGKAVVLKLDAETTVYFHIFPCMAYRRPVGRAIDWPIAREGHEKTR